MQYLGEALKENTVRNNQLFLWNFFDINLEQIMQTLTRLDLRLNEIRDNGVQYLGKALRKNTVKSKTAIILFLLYESWVYVTDTHRTWSRA